VLFSKFIVPWNQGVGKNGNGKNNAKWREISAYFCRIRSVFPQRTPLTVPVGLPVEAAAGAPEEGASKKLLTLVQKSAKVLFSDQKG
jgi:hypothetical protein